MAAAVWAIASLVHCIAVSAEVTPDVSSVRWNRATHSRALLQDALQRDSAPFVEADVVLVDGSAVLPRPVNENWTVSLSELLYRVSATPMNVTLKLNLKSTEVLEGVRRLGTWAQTVPAPHSKKREVAFEEIRVPVPPSASQLWADMLLKGLEPAAPPAEQNTRVAELRARFQDKPEEKPDVLLVQEANAHDVNLRGFILYSSPSISNNRPGQSADPPGKVLVYIKEGWNQHQIDLTKYCDDNQEIVAARTTVLRQVSVIFPDPRGSDHWPIYFEFSLTRKIKGSSKKRVVKTAHWDQFGQALEEGNFAGSSFESLLNNALKEATTETKVEEDAPTPGLHLQRIWVKRLQVVQRYTQWTQDSASPASNHASHGTGKSISLTTCRDDSKWNEDTFDPQKLLELKTGEANPATSAKFRESLGSIAKALETVSQWREPSSAAKARSLLTSILDAEFVIATLALYDALSVTLPLSRLIQKPDLEMNSALDIVKDTIVVLSEKRNPLNVEKTFKEIFAHAEEIAENMGAQLDVPRLVQRQMNCAKLPPQTAESYFRAHVYIPLVESVVEDLKLRFPEEVLEVYSLNTLLPRHVNEKGAPGKLSILAAKYGVLLGMGDVALQTIIRAEFSLWAAKWRREQEKGPLPSTAVETLQESEPELYPNIRTLLRNLKGLWFHADILPATGGEAPVNASTYLHPFASSFPQAVVSVGWTTYPETFYTWEVVDRMTRLLLCGPHLPARVSVAARASMLPNSVAQVSWMLDVIPQASLSIWAQDNDPRVTDTLIQLRKALPWSVVYYDLSEQQRADFERAKENVAYEPERTGHPVWDLPGVVACEQRPLAGRRSVILKEQGGSIRLPAAWKHFRARIDTSRSKTITLHMGSNSLTLNGDCFYVVARSTATAVIVSAWQCVVTAVSFLALGGTREDAGPRRYRVPFADEPDVNSPATTTPAAADCRSFPDIQRQDITTTGIQGHLCSPPPVHDSTF
ncbi:hypothetical protein HPB47_025200 [Ixodes persulcatus]|uniref:Uncharacterized protein n=1 Tax=Ixodes persulcatus TaxID=34615 RepID=A0AC60Q265_IXOPE|nr:hypothetical protein HPB47_025200 [Ixodes persulcatus]